MDALRYDVHSQKLLLPRKPNEINSPVILTSIHILSHKKSESLGLEKFWVGLVMDKISRRIILHSLRSIFFPLHTLFLNSSMLSDVIQSCECSFKEQIQFILIELQN